MQGFRWTAARCLHLVSFALALALLPGLTQAQAQDSSRIPLHAGAHYLHVLSVDGEGSLDALFGDQLPGGLSWAESTRLLSADRDSTLGAWYSLAEGRWLGSLEQLEAGRSYWLALPPSSAPVLLRLAGIRIEAGRVGAIQIISSTPSGQVQQRTGELPRSSVTHEVVERLPRQKNLSNDVVVIQPPGGFPPGTLLRSRLDSLGLPGSGELFVPLPTQGEGPWITTPAPQFDTPPWR